MRDTGHAVSQENIELVRRFYAELASEGSAQEFGERMSDDALGRAARGVHRDLGGEERPLRQWDFAHCPPKTEHVIVGAGDGPCIFLAMSSRENQAFGPYGEYTANELARRYGASPVETTEDGDAVPSWPESQPSRYREGWLPSS